jgi:import inner membrane translocase subunit TIM44
MNRGQGPGLTAVSCHIFNKGPATVAVRHKSALARFMESIREQVKENQEFQQNVKQLQDKSSEIAESESMRKAREVLDKAKVLRKAMLYKLVDNVYLLLYIYSIGRCQCSIRKTT